MLQQAARQVRGSTCDLFACFLTSCCAWCMHGDHQVHGACIEHITFRAMLQQPLEQGSRWCVLTGLPCMQVQPLMRRRGWIVPRLLEFYPRNACLLGLNVGGGGGRTREVKVGMVWGMHMDVYVCALWFVHCDRPICAVHMAVRRNAARPMWPDVWAPCVFGYAPMWCSHTANSSMACLSFYKPPTPCRIAVVISYSLITSFITDRNGVSLSCGTRG